MSTEALISSMELLVKLHKSLYDISVKKTEIVKNGDMESLNQILKDEQAHTAALEKVEKQRQEATKALLPEFNNPTVTDCIKNLEGIEREKLQSLTSSLTEVVFNLKDRNDLNQQLIYQSLQLVNISLNFLSPQQGSMNYAPPKKQQNLNTQGMFNSKV